MSDLKSPSKNPSPRRLSRPSSSSADSSEWNRGPWGGALGDYEFDHVGIAVPSIKEGAFFYNALGYQLGEIEEVPSEFVRVAMFELANSSRIELLEPLGNEGPVAKFLSKRGPGVHHICLRVHKIENVVDRLKEAGVHLINERPRLGAGGCRVVFVHPSSHNKILLELSEKAGENL